MKNNLLLLPLFLFITSANATTFRSADPGGTESYGTSWSFGTIFTVADNDITITTLGAFDGDKNGFLSSSIQIGIFNETDNSLLVSKNILSTDTLIGDFRYASIENLILTSGNTYRLVGVSASDDYNYNTSTFSDDFSINGFGYCSSTSLTSCDTYTESDYALSNFQYELTSVPVPAALWLLGSSLLGLAGIRKK